MNLPTPQKFSRRQRRPAFSLVEMVVVMSASAALMVVNVGWIHGSLKFASKMKQRGQQHRGLTQLAWSLRDDVHGSESMKLESDERLVLVGHDGSTITYTISDEGLNCERKRDEVMLRHDQFKFGTPSRASWDASEMPDWISLTVSRKLREQPAGDETGPGFPQHAGTAETELVEFNIRVKVGRWKLPEQEREP